MKRTIGGYILPSLYEMELAIAKYFGIRQNIIVPNISWGICIHECDLFIIRPSGYAIEIEIKRSKQDLQNDFKKRHFHNDRKIESNNYIMLFQIYFMIPVRI